MDEEGFALIERNVDTILAEIGIDYREDAEALQIWKAAGAEVDGERVRCPRGMCRSIIRVRVRLSARGDDRISNNRA